MDITDVIYSIEDIDNPVDKCVAYSELVLHLIAIKKSIGFYKESVDWKNTINDKVTECTKKAINAKIEEVKLLIELTIKNKK